MATGVSCAAALLPPIDQMALDWIPAEPEPLLMEGNGGFAPSDAENSPLSAKIPYPKM